MANSEEGLEAAIDLFQGGKRGGDLTPEEFKALASEFFDTLLYKYIKQEDKQKPIDQEYKDNTSFWTDILKGDHFLGKRVALNGFHLTEWMPSSPGKYFTKSAKSQRIAARQVLERGAIVGDSIITDVYNDTDGILLPAGKERMMLGGIGSIRLRSKEVDSRTLYFLGASSTGISHQGIPIAMNEGNYRSIIQKIKSYCGVKANLIGTLQVLPDDRSPITFERKIPRYCVLVDDVEAINPSVSTDLLITVGVMYSGRRLRDRSTNKADVLRGDSAFHPEPGLRKSWTFCSFQPDAKELALKEAIDWLRGYAIRFSGEPNPVIFSDFDEHYQHFPNPVEFDLRSLFGGKVDSNLVQEYGYAYGFNVNIEEVNFGDVFKNISRATIINRSSVTETVDEVSKKFNESTANAVLLIAEEIDKTGNTVAAELFTRFSHELQRTRPRVSILKKLWEGIIKAEPRIAQQRDTVSKIQASLFRVPE